MRYLLATGALALLFASSSALAMADPSATAPTTQSTTPVTVTAPAAPATAQAQPAATLPPVDEDAGPGTPVDSPDVAEWTAKYVRDEQTQAHHTSGHGLSKFASRILAKTTRIAKNLTRDALRFLGTPYVFGGTSSSGFDCSGFVQHVFAMLGVTLPRTADAQYYAGNRVKGGMKAGDLVFFQTYAAGPSHVGIYLGHGRFVHASSHGVMVSSLSDSYWSERYLGAKRFIAQR